MSFPIAICGDTHGLLDLMYSKSAELGAKHIIQLGDTGIYSSRSTLDAATLRHGAPDDCERYLSGSSKVPIPTTFIQGNHEDFDLLDDWERNGTGIENWHYAKNGSTFSLGGIVFGVLGGNFSSKYFNHKSLAGGRRRHFLSSQMDQLYAAGDIDVLLLHDGPKSSILTRGCSELNTLIERINPSIVYHGHHHFSYQTKVSGVDVVGLGKAGDKQPWVMLHG